MRKAVNDKKDMDELIAGLAGDLKPVRRFPHPLKLVLGWSAVVAIYMVLMIYVLDIRVDFTRQMENSAYLFELIMSLSISVSAGFAALWLCIPDMRGQKWMLVPPIVLLGAFTVWLALRAAFDEFSAQPSIWCHCSTEAVLFGIVPAVVIFMMSRKGKTTYSWLLPFMNALAVGGMGYAGMRVVCISEDIGHILLYHAMPYFAFAFLATMLGQRIYRW